ncbi:MAG: hypothetical protein E6713_06055 [Sporomusaceae bacterium]|nr:hypothetical protein [Sporomusaceae bacterium]
MPKEVTLKLTVDSSDSKMVMDVYKNEKGLLVFDLYDKDTENGFHGGTVEVDSEEFLDKLNKLLTATK